MKNKGILGVSSALIRENFKLCWYLPALAFLLYFFAGIFPIILNLSDIGSIARYIDNSLNNYNVVYPLYMAGIPLVAAMLMMSFFHKPARHLLCMLSLIQGQSFLTAMWCQAGSCASSR